MNLSNLLEPFIPNTCEKIRRVIENRRTYLELYEAKEGRIDEIAILFNKIDKKRAMKR